MKKLVLAIMMTGMMGCAYATDASAPMVEKPTAHAEHELTDAEARQLELETIPLVEKMMAMGATSYMMGEIPYGSHEEKQLLQLSTLTLSMELTSNASKAYAYSVISIHYKCTNPGQSDDAKKQIYKTVMNDNSVKMSERKSIVTAYYKLINQRSCKAPAKMKKANK